MISCIFSIYFFKNPTTIIICDCVIMSTNYYTIERKSCESCYLCKKTQLDLIRWFGNEEYFCKPCITQLFDKNSTTEDVFKKHHFCTVCSSSCDAISYNGDSKICLVCINGIFNGTHVQFDGGYERTGKAIIMNSKCYICKQKNIKTLVVDNSEEEYNSIGLCWTCISVMFQSNQS